MAWRWLWSSAIDPSAPISEAELQRIASHAEHRAHFRSVLRASVQLAPTVLLLTVGAMNIDVFADWVGGPWPAVLALSVALLVVTMASGMIEHHFFLVPHIRREFRRRGYEVCERCGYWLEKLDESIQRCPECGGQRESMPHRASSGLTPDSARSESRWR
jgi:hypothetical protein